MNGKIHFTAGIMSTAAVGIYLYNKDLISINTMLSMTGIGTFAALLPDLDTQNSSLGKIVPIFPWFLENFFGHRGMFHSFFPILLFFLAERYFFPFSIYSEIAFLIGWTSHLLLDTLTPMGIMWRYPFSKKKYTLNQKKAIRKANKKAKNG